MKKLLAFVVLCTLSCASWSQFRFALPVLRGPDADQYTTSWASAGNLFLPYDFFGLMNGSGAIRIQPSLCTEWIDFEENFIVNREQGVTIFEVDQNASHQYPDKWFKNSSTMKFTTVSLPIGVVTHLTRSSNIAVNTSVFLDYMVGGRFIREYSVDGIELEVQKKFRDEEFYGLRRFQYGFFASVSYKFISIYGKYSLSPMFESAQAIDLRKHHVGVAVNLFYNRL